MARCSYGGQIHRCRLSCFLRYCFSSSFWGLPLQKKHISIFTIACFYACSLTTPKLSSPTFQKLCRSLPISVSLPKTLTFLSRNPFRSCSRSHQNQQQQYDYDLFTIGAGSGVVRASRFAANFGAKVAVCELPFLSPPYRLIQLEALGEQPKHDWSTLMANKNAELHRLTGIYKNILDNANVELIEGSEYVIVIFSPSCLGESHFFSCRFACWILYPCRSETA